MRIKLDIPMSVGEIATAVGGICELKLRNKIINYITTDTGELSYGDLFVALKGKKYDANDFTDKAEKIGAISLTQRRGKGYVTVTKSDEALMLLASYYKGFFTNLKHTVAVTGSVGKSTTKEFLSVIASTHLCVHKSEGNHNNNIGLPLSILSAKRDCEIMVLEMGMNAEGEIKRLSECAMADIGIITNIGTSHIGNLGSRENIARAKLELKSAQSISAIIVPKDEKLLYNAPKKHTFSTTDITANTAVIGKENGSVEIYFDGKHAFSSHLEPKGEHFIKCLAPAVAAARLINMDFGDIKTGISQISDINIRQKLISAKNFYILDDSYNASYESISADLSLLESLNTYAARSALLGTVFELGEHAAEMHYRIGRRAAEAHLDRLYLFGDYSHDMKRGAINGGMSSERIFVNTELSAPEITAEEILRRSVHSEIILFKASNAVRLDRILKLILA